MGCHFVCIIWLSGDLYIRHRKTQLPKMSMWLDHFPLAYSTPTASLTNLCVSFCFFFCLSVFTPWKEKHFINLLLICKACQAHYLKNLFHWLPTGRLFFSGCSSSYESNVAPWDLMAAQWNFYRCLFMHLSLKHNDTSFGCFVLLIHITYKVHKHSVRCLA